MKKLKNHTSPGLPSATRNFLLRSAAAVSLAASLATTRAATIEVAVRGDLSPDGVGLLSRFFPGQLTGRNSTFAFNASLTGAPLGSDAILIRASAGATLETIAREGDAPPEGDGIFSTFGDPIIDATGHVVFLGHLINTPGPVFGIGTNEGLYQTVSPTSTALRTIARAGQPAPGTDKLFFGLSTPVSSPTGEYVFGANLSDDLVNLSASGIYRASPGLAPELLAVSETQAPDGETFLDFDGPAFVTGRHFAFGARTTDPVNFSRTSLWLSQPDASPPLRKLTAEGPVEFEDGITRLVGELGHPFFNSSGQASLLTGGRSIIKLTPSAFSVAHTHIASVSDPAPDGDGNFLALDQGPDINDLGQVLYWARLENTPGGHFDNDVIYRHEEGSSSRIVREGETPPDGGGTYASFSSVKLNNLGHILFRTTLRDTPAGAADNTAIYLSDPTGTSLTKIIREGDTLSGRSTTGVFPISLNDYGIVLFRAEFTDGGEGLYLWLPDDSINYTHLADGSWDNPEHWSYGLLPNQNFHTAIEPSFPATVIGPQNPVTIASLTVDATGPLPTTLNLQPGGPITITDGVTLDHGIISGSGSLLGAIYAGDHSVIRPSPLLALGDSTSKTGFNSTGLIDIGAGSLTLLDSKGASLAGTTTLSGGILNLPDQSGQLGSLSGYGTINGSFGNTGLLAVTPGQHLLIGGKFENQGELNCITASATFLSVVTNSKNSNLNARDAVLNFKDGFTNSGLVALSFGTSDIFGPVANIEPGSIILSGDAQVTFWDDFVNNGTEFRVAANTSAVFFGDVTGSGPFKGTGSTYFEAGFSPGNSPASVLFDGSVTFGKNADLTFEIGGTSAGNSYDQIVSTGSFHFDSANLAISLIEKFTPAVGDSFEIFVAPAMTGSLGVIQLPTLPQGIFWDTSTLTTDGILRVALSPGFYSDWRRGWDLPSVDTGDHDGDGIDDLIECYLALDPTTDNTGEPGLPVTVIGKIESASHGGIEFNVPTTTASDLRCIVESTSNLIVWNTVLEKTGNGSWTGSGHLQSDPAAGGRQTIRILDTEPLTTNSLRYFRLSVTLMK